MTRLIDHGGGVVDLADLAGVRHAIVLLPGAFTPVCTRELPGIEHLWRRAGRRGMPVLAVSCDGPAVLAAWREAEGITMPLLSDFWPHGRLARELSALDEATGRCRRTSAVIGADGAVAWREESATGAARDLGRLAAALGDL